MILLRVSNFFHSSSLRQIRQLRIVSGAELFDRSCGMGRKGMGKGKGKGGPPTHSASRADWGDESWKGENGSGLFFWKGGRQGWRDKADPISSSFSNSNGFSLSVSYPSLPSPSLPPFLPSGWICGWLIPSLLPKSARHSRG